MECWRYLETRDARVDVSNGSGDRSSVCGAGESADTGAARVGPEAPVQLPSRWVSAGDRGGRGDPESRRVAETQVFGLLRVEVDFRGPLRAVRGGFEVVC
jgi:hypothetical protein